MHHTAFFSLYCLITYPVEHLSHSIRTRSSTYRSILENREMDFVAVPLQQPSSRRPERRSSFDRSSEHSRGGRILSVHFRSYPSSLGSELASSHVSSLMNPNESFFSQWGRRMSGSELAGGGRDELRPARSISCTPLSKSNSILKSRQALHRPSLAATTALSSTSSLTSQSRLPPFLIRSVSEPAASRPSSSSSLHGSSLFPKQPSPHFLSHPPLFLKWKQWIPRFLRKASGRRKVVVVPPTRESIRQASTGPTLGGSRTPFRYPSGPSTIVYTRSLEEKAAVNSSIAGGEEGDRRSLRTGIERGEPGGNGQGQRLARGATLDIFRGPESLGGSSTVYDYANRPVGSSLTAVGYEVNSTAWTASVACFAALGFTSMVSWSFLFGFAPAMITTLSLFSQERNNHGFSDLSVFSAFQLSGLAVQVFLLCIGALRKGVLLFGGWMSVFVFIVLTPFMAYLPAKSGHISIYILCIVTGIGSRFLLGGAFSLAGALCPDFIAALSIGNGLAGVFISSIGVTLALASSGGSYFADIPMIGWSFYIFATLIAVISVVGISWLVQQPWVISTFKRVERQRLERMKTYMRRHHRKQHRGERLVTIVEETEDLEEERERKAEEQEEDERRREETPARPRGVTEELQVGTPLSPSDESYPGTNEDLEASDAFEDQSSNDMSNAVRPRLEQQSQISSLAPDNTTTTPYSQTAEGWSSGYGSGQQQSYSRSYDLSSFSRSHRPLPPLPFRTFCQVLRYSLVPNLLSAFLTFFVTRNIFPRLGPILWNFRQPFPYSLLIYGAVFVWSDLLGRCLPVFGRIIRRLRRWIFVPQKYLLPAVLMRGILYIPFVLGGKLHDTPILNSRWWYGGNVAALGLTHGWLCTLSYIYTVDTLNRLDEREFTGPLSIIAISLGTVAGLFSSYLY